MACAKPIRVTEAVLVTKPDGTRGWSDPEACVLDAGHGGKCSVQTCLSELDEQAALAFHGTIRCKLPDQHGAQLTGVPSPIHRWDNISASSLPFTLTWNQCVCSPHENEGGNCPRCGGAIPKGD